MNSNEIKKMSVETNNTPRPFPADNAIEFGNWFRKERKSRNFTQSDIAEMANVTRQTIGEIENGGNVGFFLVLRALKSMGLGLTIDASGHQSMISMLFEGK